jgi:SCY1-like protein 2
MFSALKSYTSNINSNYTISQPPASVSGPWRIHDAKNKSTGKEVSVFVFDRKVLEPHAGGLSRGSAASLKKAADEVVERLRKEASSLARLRHPNILELVEPVEETRNGLQFATEAVTASLAGLLQDKDEQERAGGIGGRTSRYVVEDPDGERRRRDVEIDELEIQKGLLQISKALEFLHDNAGLVHGNLTPEAVFINAKSDWKISGLSFLSPPDNSNKPTSITPISLSEVLNYDARFPRSVQLNLDYASPDLVLDNNLNALADMFSLGLLIVALYNSPHHSPLETNSSITTYKRLFSSSSSTPSATNNFISSRPLPKDLTNNVLPRLITRRPAQRMTAKDFQQSPYFDNILVSTIRFLESLPAKSPNEKAQFMRGLARVIPSFPKSVLEKKILPALLEEMKDRELLSLILQDIFKIIQILPTGKRSFSEKILPRLREIFLAPSGQKTQGAPERDPAKEAGVMVLLENIKVITGNCSGKEFKDDVLPIIHLAIESSTHSLVDAALRTLPTVLPVLDFSTIKNDLFPVIAAVYTKTSSLGIKVRALEAFVILCGGSLDNTSSDGLDGMMSSDKKKSTATALDKYTMQEKILPLIKGIKTKEPAVMLAALKVLKQVGAVADTEFIAFDILPALWNMSLGPLLNLTQFQAFMELIKELSSRVENEHTRKLQELSSSAQSAPSNDDFMSFGGVAGFTPADLHTSGGNVDDFERLVQGKVTSNGSSSTSPLDAAWDAAPNKPAAAPAPAPAFSWSTPSSNQPSMGSVLRPQPRPASRTVTPDLSTFGALAPQSTQFSQPLQPTPSTSAFPPPPQPRSQAQQALPPPLQPALNWSTATPNAWSSNTTTTAGLGNPGPKYGLSQQRPVMNTSSSFSLPPPPSVPLQSPFQSPMTHRPNVSNTRSTSFTPQQTLQSAFGTPMNQQQAPPQPSTQKTGLDAYESLL